MTDPKKKQPTPMFSAEVEAWIWAELRNGLEDHEWAVIAPRDEDEDDIVD